MVEEKVAWWPARRPRSGFRLIAGAAVVAVALASTMSAQAQRHGGPGMGGMMFEGPPERVGHVVDRMLDGLNATDAQRSQIKQIAVAAAQDLRAQRETGRGMHERSLQIFTAPTVDANSAEALRQQMETQHDQASKRVLQAMLDVSRVLTPEQRAKIGDRMKERQSMMQERMQRMERERAQRAPAQQ
jgi:periplasmic protein CpxP/Spy